jgi:hypothetical protein
MKRILHSVVLSAALVIAPTASFAGRNPAVQPIFFQQLESVAPASQPAPVAQVGSIVEVTYAGLAWEVNNVKNTHIPLVVELVSGDPAACAAQPGGLNECLAQYPASDRTALAYAGRVRFVRFNVQQHPGVLNGPDVRVLPTHLFIADYTDSTHYTAIKVWGLIDQSGLEQVIQETFNIAP